MSIGADSLKPAGLEGIAATTESAPRRGAARPAGKNNESVQSRPGLVTSKYSPAARFAGGRATALTRIMFTVRRVVAISLRSAPLSHLPAVFLCSYSS